MPRQIHNRWFGVLNTENVDQVADVIREMLKGRFCIAEASYIDSQAAQLRIISADCEIDSQWTSEPTREHVRVFRDEGAPWIGFSAGGYLWMFHAREDGGGEHEDYRYPYISFEYDKFIVTQRAPAGKGYLHQRAFGAHREDSER